METEPGEKKFDCVKWTREVRDRINEEIADLSGEELREWFSRRPTDPILARLFDLRKAPEGRKTLDEAVGERGAGLPSVRREAVRE